MSIKVISSSVVVGPVDSDGDNKLATMVEIANESDSIYTRVEVQTLLRDEDGLILATDENSTGPLVPKGFVVVSGSTYIKLNGKTAASADCQIRLVSEQQVRVQAILR
ncbi:MAG: hypothetical protein H6741_20200 [Alphaproteobacteria bacterium]|nr:hypothetical protein [Alphaproteobacteria bacterium]